jgi:hypothetical protein
VLLVIGDQWQSERLADDGDFVRMELLEALRQELPIIPVLIEGTLLPERSSLPEELRPILNRNVARIRRDPDFRRDAANAIGALANLARIERERRQRAAEAAAHEAALVAAKNRADELRANADRLSQEHADQVDLLQHLEDEHERRMASERALLTQLAGLLPAAEAEAARAAEAWRQLQRPQSADGEAPPRGVPPPSPPGDGEDRSVTVPTPVVVTTLERHAGSVQAVSWSPDGRHLATASADGTVLVWNPTTATTAGPPLTGHTGWVLAVAWSSDGARLATGGADQIVRIWDRRAPAQVDTPLTAHLDSVRAVAWAPDGIHLATGSDRQDGEDLEARGLTPPRRGAAGAPGCSPRSRVDLCRFPTRIHPRWRRAR